MAGLIALVVAATLGIFVMRRFTTEEAIADARERTQVIAQGIIEPNLTEGVLASDPAALQDFDEIVSANVIEGPVFRVKLWALDGTIVYSDEPRLIGSTYELDDEKLGSIETGAVEAETSDLSGPENRFETVKGEVVEVYLNVTAPDGTDLLFETYQRSESINAGSRRILVAVAPALLGALALLQLVHLPLAWSMGRRLERARSERELLLQRAIDASNAERRRIASDLHDGIVQDLAGISLSLSGLADRTASDDDGTVAETLRKAASATRQEIRELRTLLVEIHPPNLHAVGLPAALSDLVQPLVARGIQVDLEVDGELRLPVVVESLLFRAANEALRNVADHSQATGVRLAIRVEGGRASLEVSDDGVGFSPRDKEHRKEEGHFGLDLLAGLVRDAGGEMRVDPSPGKGTRVVVEGPAS